VDSACGIFAKGTVQAQTCNTQPCPGMCPPLSWACGFCEISGTCYSTSDMIECVEGKKENFVCACNDSTPCQHAVGCQCLPLESNGQCPSGTCNCWKYRHTAAKTCIGCPCITNVDEPCIQANDRHCMGCNSGVGTLPCVGCWEGPEMTGLWYAENTVSPTTSKSCTSQGWVSCNGTTCG
jgi:hypothetical protein